MDARAIYEKFKGTEPLSDEELDYIIDYLRDLESKLCLGLRFEIARDEIIRCLITLERWKSARKFFFD